MANAAIRSEQIKDGQVKRADLNTATSGSAVITKVIAGTGISLSSTGADAGTGDVTVNASGGGISTLKNGIDSKAMSDASGNQTIAHGLGATPKYFRMTVYHNASSVSNTRTSTGSFNGSNYCCVVNSNNGTDAYFYNYIAYIETSAGAYQRATVSWDSTNVTIAWTKTGSPTGTAYFMWEAWT